VILLFSDTDLNILVVYCQYQIEFEYLLDGELESHHGKLFGTICDENELQKEEKRNERLPAALHLYVNAVLFC
jgi:hypothetical protein